MAMNKKEKAHLLALEQRASLHWSDPTDEELACDLPEPWTLSTKETPHAS